jgi:hypothetical protein
MYGAPPSGSLRPNEKTAEKMRIGMSGVRNVHSTPLCGAGVRPSEIVACERAESAAIGPQRNDLAGSGAVPTERSFSTDHHLHSPPNSYANDFKKPRFEHLARRIRLAHFSGLRQRSPLRSLSAMMHSSRRRAADLADRKWFLST